MVIPILGCAFTACVHECMYVLNVCARVSCVKRLICVFVCICSAFPTDYLVLRLYLLIKLDRTPPYVNISVFKATLCSNITSDHMGAYRAHGSTALMSEDGSAHSVILLYMHFVASSDTLPPFSQKCFCY